MNFYQAAKGSLDSLASHKLRSFLTMFGMIIGISSVIIIMSIGSSAQSLILDQIKSVGSNLVGVLPGATSEGGPPASVMGVTVTTLKYEDALALAQTENVPHALAAAAYVKGVATVSWRNRSVDTNINGTTASYLNVEDVAVAQGRFFTVEEERSIARVVVLGSEVDENLFEGQDPIGQLVRIKREQFKVIGVMAARGSAAFQNEDDQVFVPVSAAQKLLLGIDHLGYVRVKIDATENLEQSEDDIVATLREQHGITDPTQDDFTVRNMQQALDVFTSVTDALKFFLAAIAAIALLVGGIGIMNIMLVSVNERVHEIGLRKAVGAPRRSIMKQFLVETVVVAFGGGLIGIVIGALVSGIIAAVAQYLGYSWRFIVTPDSIAVASGVSIMIGLFFGLYPAYKASKLDPIEALRYE